MSIRKTTYIHKSRSNKKELPSAVDDAADVMSKYSKNKRKNTSNPNTAVLSLISDTKNIKEVTIKSNIVVPKSGCIKIKNRFIKTPDIAINLFDF